jgi:isopenicillin N synthase-like dioxygenase
MAGDIDASNDGNIGAGPHSDFGMPTLLATDGTPGLQVLHVFLNFKLTKSTMLPFLHSH